MGKTVTKKGGRKTPTPKPVDDFMGESPEEQSENIFDSAIDLTDATGGDFTPPQPGTYDVSLEEANCKVSSKGSSMIEWVFRIDGPKNANSKLWDYTVLNNPVGISRIKAIVVALGMEESELKNFVPSRDVAELVGRTCRVATRIEKRTDGVEGLSAKIVAYKPAATGDAFGS